MKQLQLRNLKRLREKVKEEEEKLRALKSAAAKIKEASASGSIGENEMEEDYDADCSALESPHKKLTAAAVSSSNNAAGNRRSNSIRYDITYNVNSNNFWVISILSNNFNNEIDIFQFTKNLQSSVEIAFSYRDFKKNR